MIVDERTYTLHPSGVRPFLQLFEAEGLEIQTRFLGTLLGYFTTETGTLNQVVHWWRFDDLQDRQARRARLWADPDWVAYADKVLPYIARMENRLLTPTAFSPLQ